MNIRRRTVLKGLGAAVIGTTLLRSRSAAAAEFTLKFATLAPKSSPWGKVLETLIKAITEKSGGKLELQVFYNGQQGDEDAMVAKIKSGQLDGALIGVNGLNKVDKTFGALAIPFLFTDAAKLTKARDALKADYEKAATAAGFTFMGWCDLGDARVFSKGFAIKTPDDLKGKKPVMVRADPNLSAMLSAIGGVSGVPLNVPEILPNLNTGGINVVIASSLHAEQLQWASKLDNLNSMVVNTAIGGFVFGKKVIEALPEDLRTMVGDMSKVASAALQTKIRSEDAAAYERLKKKMTVSTPSAEELAKWTSIGKATREKLRQGTYSNDLVKKLEGY